MDERRAAMNARMDAKREAAQVRTAARLAKVEGWGSKGAPPVDMDTPGDAPVLYAPSFLGSVAAAVIPGVAIYQAAKSDKSAKAVRDAMTPEQQAQARRFPMGQGGA